MKLLITVALSAIITSCTPVQNAKIESSNTVNKTWELVSLQGEQVNTNMPVYITLDGNNKVSGKTGCNTLNGNFSITNGTQIRFSQLASSRMMCAAYDMKIEKEVLDVLNTADNFTLNDGKLMLNVGRRAPLAVFAEMSTNPIINKYWTLKEMNGKAVTMSSNQEKEQGFMLRSNGAITGFAGCNNFFGTYNLSGNNGISIGENLGMTMKACPDVMVNEKEFTTLFKNTKSYEIKGNILLLRDSNRKLLATFEVM